MATTLQQDLELLGDEQLRAVISAIGESAVEIAGMCRDDLGAAQPIGAHNAFGDAQLKIDVQADEMIERRLRKSGVVCIAASEERPEERALCAEGRFAVAYDPLDGSSVIGSNFAVGSIFGVWEGRGLIGVRGADMVASVASVYGPRITLFAAARGWTGVREWAFVGGEWRNVGVVHCMGAGKLFAPANLRATRELTWYARLVDWYRTQRYTLRYTGGMVADVTQLVVRGYGVYMSPASTLAPCKLRLLFEVLPLAHLVTAAGGRACDMNGDVLERRVNSMDERSAVCIGSLEEVDRFESYRDE